MQPGICLCMIVRNEENSLERCLQSCRPWVDDIVVLDTGSCDQSQAIARSWGARVFDHCWEDDFAAARNASLDLAGQEWVLVLDADEELPQYTGEQLHDLIRSEEVAAWSFMVHSPLSSSTEAQVMKHPSVRLFRSHPGYRFQGRIHEQITPAIMKHGGMIGNSNLVVWHYGYQQDRPGRDMKNKRNTNLLEKAVADEPENGYLLYQVGVSLYRSGQLEKAQSAFSRSMSAPGFSLPALFRDYAVCLVAMGQLTNALQVIESGLACYQDYADLYFLRGEIFYDCGLMDQAASSFKQCMLFKMDNSSYVTIAGVNSYLALENLAEISELLNDREAALDLTRQALQLSPSISLWRRYGHLCQIYDQRGQEYRQQLETDFKLSVREKADLLYASGFYDHCLEMIASQEPDPGLLVLAIRCMQRSGQPYPPLIAWLDTWANLSPCPELIIIACLYHWQQKPAQDAAFLSNYSDSSSDPYIQAARQINNYILGAETDPTPLPRQLILDFAVTALEFDHLKLACQISTLISGEQPEVIRSLAKVCLASGMYNWTIKLLETLFEPDNEDLSDLAQAYRLLGYWQKSFLCYAQMAADISPDPLLAARIRETLAASLQEWLLKNIPEKQYSPYMIRHIVELAAAAKTWHYHAERFMIGQRM